MQIRPIQGSRKEYCPLGGRFVSADNGGKLKNFEQVGKGLAAECSRPYVSSLPLLRRKDVDESTDHCLDRSTRKEGF